MNNYVELKDVAEIRGRVGWKGYTIEDLVDEGPLVLGANDITVDNQLNLSQVKHLTREKFEESPEIMIKKNDILVVKVGSTIGKVTIINKELGEASINPNCVIVRANKINPYYLYYFMCSPEGKAFLINNSAASGQPALNQTDLKKMKIPYIEIDKQEKISYILNKINNKIENNNKINEELESMAKTIYDYWFLQFDFPDENGKPYKSSGGKMVWNEELKKEIPEGWEVGNLYDIADFINGLACQKFRPINEEHILPVIKIGEMHDGFTSNTEYVRSDIDEKYIVNNGDILFSWSATLETMVWTKGRGGLNQHIFKVNPKKYPKYYVFLQLSSYIINFIKMAEARKTTMGHITKDHIKQSKIVLPPIDITNRYEKKIDKMFNQIINNEKQNQQLTSLRDFLLPLLMNGQVAFKEE